MQSSPIRVEAEVYPVVSHAMAHNRISPVRTVTLANDDGLRTGLEIRIGLRDGQGALSEQFTTHADLEQGSTTTLRDIAFHLDPAAMNQVEEARPGTLDITVLHQDEVVGSHTLPVTVLASRQWLWKPSGLALELLAAHVMPNAPEVTSLLGVAADHLRQRTGQSQVDGYQSGPERVDELVAAIYQAISDAQIRYSEPPASWTDEGQKIRTPADLLETRLGTCLDTTLLFAAALEQAGLRAQVWMLAGHAFVGWWRQESDSWAAVSSEAPDMVNRLDLGQLGVLETTLATERANPASFADARAAATQRIHQDPDAIIGILDVWAARRSRILPLPAITRTPDGGLQTVVYQPAQHSVAPAVRATTEAETARAVTRDGKPVPARVHQWKNALLDLSLRNRLINFSERAAVRLNVSPALLPDLENLITSGRHVTLTPGDAFDNVYLHRDGIQSAAELPPEVLDETLLATASVFTDLSSEAYVTRLRNLAYKARTVEEETGANNLYLALGTLVWELDGKHLRSPLVLVPLHLVASARRGSTFRLVLDETGTSTPNYCLLEKLRLTFGLALPTLAQPPVDELGIDLAAAIRGVREALVARKLPFRVEETAHVSLLQFAKFRLWKDLEENWETLLDSPLAHHLAHTPTLEFADPVTPDADQHLDELGLLCPIPADGSQLGAIADAMTGRTFVLEGPPGTGKSQTIANLLARGIAEGKRILFVAEKRAALDVVARRVRAVGLGEFTLDLHNRDSRPAHVRHQIARSLDLAPRSDSEGLAAITEHARTAGAALSRYATRLHEPNGAQLSLYSAETNRCALGAGPTLTLPPLFVTPGKEQPIAELRRLVTRLPYVADAARPSATGPWTFAQVDDAAGLDLPTISRACRDADDRVLRLADRLTTSEQPDPLSTALRTACAPADLALLAELLDAGSPPLALLDEARQPGWGQCAQAAQQEAAAFAATAPSALGVATPATLDLPLDDIHTRALAAAQSSWFGRRKRLLAVLAELSPTLASGAAVAAKEVPAFVRHLAELRHALLQVTGQVNSVPGVVLASDWKPVNDEAVTELNTQLTWLAWAADRVAPNDASPFVEALRHYLADPRPALSCAPAGQDAAQLVRELATALGYLQQQLGAADTDFHDWSGEGGLIGRWQQTADARDLPDPSLGSLTRWLEFRKHLAAMLAWGLDEAHRQLLVGEVTGDDATLALERGLVAASLVERLRNQGLDSFDQRAHNETVRRFCDHSGAVREAIKTELATQALARRTFSSQATSGQVGELRREIGRQRGGLSVRDLMGRHGSLITEVMPCVLVSPDSLARFFPVGAVGFDLVVFDEASQIKVADAIGAIGRARSVVVVGDSKQMPPTSVAEISLHGDETDEDDLETTGAVEDEESILSECVQARVHRRWLSWHYRSQDEALIAFSNARYYDGRLSSFPAPTRGVPDPGVNGHGIRHIRVDGTFLRSGKGRALRTNPVEAQAILDEIRRRFDAAPAGTMPSIGVVTFNLQQRALIESMIRDSDDPRMVAALEATTGDGLFVKNLENVQGDERDAVLFSTAFSVNDKGVLPLNFGPLNLSGGERRLNVAITRARRQVIIYSSFDPAQLRAEESSSLGLKHLREYLDVAVGGEAELASTTGRAVVRDRHRDEIAERLQERGVVVRTDVGLSDFRVDLVLARPDAPDQPLVAVLLDGPGWATRATVNDRDALGSQVLAAMLRWPAVERVWLPTWLAHPDQVLDQLSQVVGQAQLSGFRQETVEIPVADEVAEHPQPGAPRAASTQQAPARAETTRDPQREPARGPDFVPAASAARAIADPAHHGAPSTRTQAPDAPVPFRPWQPSTVGEVAVLDALSGNSRARAKVLALIEEGVAVEGPVHAHRLARKVANAFGLVRVTQPRIDAILQAGRLRPDEHGFLWPPGLTAQSWTLHRPDPTQDRPVEHISPHELANALHEVALASGGITPEELKKVTSELFGFRRLTAGVGEALDAALTLALQTGRLRWENELLRGQSG